MLDNAISIGGITWSIVAPDSRGTWLTKGLEEEFDHFIAMGLKDAKSKTIFSLFSNGVKTNRDKWVYNFNGAELERNVCRMVDTYNDHVRRFLTTDRKVAVDAFVDNDETKISWSGDLKIALSHGKYARFNEHHKRVSMYRPFTRQHLYFDRLLNNSIYQLSHIFPPRNEIKNYLICLTGVGSEKPFLALISDSIPDVHLSGPGCTTQCFPFYTYDEDGTHRRENITDWVLAEFRRHYDDESITKWEIFYYVYALLHHPEYRERYAANLKRDLPRIPFVPEFKAYAAAGARLAEIHVNYEQQPEYPLQMIEDRDQKLDWQVEKMKLSKDRMQIQYNDFLTLAGIPPETFEYRLGNRSALDWVIDQYRVKTDERSGIVNDPNRVDDPEYIVRLIKQVVTVSLETVKIVNDLPKLVVDVEPQA